MIPPRGRPVKPFELIRWARDAASWYDLPLLEAHLLVVLATYANDECEAWPSLRTLAADCNRKVKPNGTCSAVSAALTGLQERALIWTVQAGRGRSPVRELLFDPDRDEQPADALLRSGSADACVPDLRKAPCRSARRTATTTDGEVPDGENGHMKPSGYPEGFSPTEPDDEAERRRCRDALAAAGFSPAAQPPESGESAGTTTNTEQAAPAAGE